MIRTSLAAGRPPLTRGRWKTRRRQAGHRGGQSSPHVVHVSSGPTGVMASRTRPSLVRAPPGARRRRHPHSVLLSDSPEPGSSAAISSRSPRWRPRARCETRSSRRPPTRHGVPAEIWRTSPGCGWWTRRTFAVPVEPVGRDMGLSSLRVPATITLRGSARKASISPWWSLNGNLAALALVEPTGIGYSSNVEPAAVPIALGWPASATT